MDESHHYKAKDTGLGPYHMNPFLVTDTLYSSSFGPIAISVPNRLHKARENWLELVSGTVRSFGWSLHIGSGDEGLWALAQGLWGHKQSQGQKSSNSGGLKKEKKRGS